MIVSSMDCCKHMHIFRPIFSKLCWPCAWSEGARQCTIWLFNKTIQKMGKVVNMTSRVPKTSIIHVNLLCIPWTKEGDTSNISDQDATQLIVIQVLLTRDAESGISQKLQLSFGQAVRFKKEFSHLLPSAPSTSSTPKPGNGNSKPTMGQLSSFTPALRRLYLTK